ncbi:MAG TPA: hypothetical protein VM925_24065 [Labilithrix sp.]|nr:hypothetical protein [Labilithrix sp.]
MSTPTIAPAKNNATTRTYLLASGVSVARFVMLPVMWVTKFLHAITAPALTKPVESVNNVHPKT